MKVLKYVVALFAATFVFAGVATGSAMALTGTGDVVIDGGEPCPVTYTYTGSVPGSGSIDDMDATGCEYEGIAIDIDPTRTSLSATFTGSASAGTLDLGGQLSVTVLGGLFGCVYNTAATGGTGPLSGPYAGSGGTTTFDIDTATLIQTSSFGFGCPVGNLSNVEIQNGVVS